MKRIITAIFLTLLVAKAAIAAGTTANPTLNQTMTEIGKVMVDIFPLVLTQRELSKDEQSVVGSAIKRLSRLFQTAGPHILKKSDAYQISYQFISDYLKVTQRVYDSGDINYTRSHFYALGELCTSCHTQDTKWRTIFQGASRSQFASDFSYGEFNYITRNYTEAISYYDKHLLSPKKKNELELIRPLQRLITIYTQILNQPGKGASVLKKYLSLKNHTNDSKKQLAQWISGLEQLESSGVAKLKTVDFKTLEIYVTQYLGAIDQVSAELFVVPQVEVLRVWLRGLLYHYLNGNPSQSEIPKILYWLSRAERSIAYNFYFSLADLYLKQCVIKYPNHPYAKLCLTEYQRYVDHNYADTNGSDIPPEIKKELAAMIKALAGK